MMKNRNASEANPSGWKKKKQKYNHRLVVSTRGRKDQRTSADDPCRRGHCSRPDQSTSHGRGTLGEPMQASWVQPGRLLPLRDWNRLHSTSLLSFLLLNSAQVYLKSFSVQNSYSYRFSTHRALFTGLEQALPGGYQHFSRNFDFDISFKPLTSQGTAVKLTRDFWIQ